jgi:hypothetical protein
MESSVHPVIIAPVSKRPKMPLSELEPRLTQGRRRAMVRLSNPLTQMNHATDCSVRSPRVRLDGCSPICSHCRQNAQRKVPARSRDRSRPQPEGSCTSFPQPIKRANFFFYDSPFKIVRQIWTNVVKSGVSQFGSQLTGFLLLCLLCAFYTIPLSIISFVANLASVCAFSIFVLINLWLTSR